MASHDKDKKPGFFKSITGAIDDVMSEIKADVQSMTPPTQQPTAEETRRAREKAEEQQRIAALVGSSSAGLAETEIEEGPEPAPIDEEPEPQQEKRPPRFSANEPSEFDEERQHQPPKKLKNTKLPTGNLWDVLKDTENTTRLRADICYHAFKMADLTHYAQAVSDENTIPYTLALLATNVPAPEEGSDAVPAMADVLNLSMFTLLEKQPRLFGALGAGPRSLWPNLEHLDTHLTQLLNAHTKIVAVGPIGLDEPFAPYTIAEQQAQLARQLEIAADFQIPALITTRKSHLRLEETLSAQKNLPTLVYLDPILTSEDLSLVKSFNMYATLRPELTDPAFPNASAYRQIPPSRLLVASGSALVAPHGFAGHFNQPRFLQNSLEAAAKMLALKPDELLALTNRNLAQLFGQ